MNFCSTTTAAEWPLRKLLGHRPTEPAETEAGPWDPSAALHLPMRGAARAEDNQELQMKGRLQGME